ncbi:hypothetical protein GCM10011575_25100 [Microlunatus endophyticus]|uniref:DUF4282 domain-containing protein n=1 Tax=Microlunatus endophyticus TaxID=1716077 RepID=A0A917SBC8_9ACTN|nr:DUF4282 domain-containing protein [Microlunatus endophyticus]GGL65657.1 hypothetical protein GCM10011575_25100 [Microlunatus endophyticus]
MTQPPNPPGGNQPHHDPQQFGQHNQWITGSSESASRPEETQQLPPYGQSSAAQPQAGSYSQPSAGSPYGQPPTQPLTQPPAQPQSQPYAQPTAPSWGQPPSGAPDTSSFGAWQSQPPQQLQPQQQKRFGDANPFRAAFDFGFRTYATPGIAKIVYIVAIVLGVVAWIGGAIYWFRVAAAINHLASSLSSPFGGGGDSNAGSAFTVIGIVSLVLGWIPVLLEILIVRVFLEAAIAMTRTADDARHIREKIED